MSFAGCTLQAGFPYILAASWIPRFLSLWDRCSPLTKRPILAILEGHCAVELRRLHLASWIPIHPSTLLDFLLDSFSRLLQASLGEQVPSCELALPTQCPKVGCKTNSTAAAASLQTQCPKVGPKLYRTSSSHVDLRSSTR